MRLKFSSRFNQHVPTCPGDAVINIRESVVLQQSIQMHTGLTLLSANGKVYIFLQDPANTSEHYQTTLTLLQKIHLFGIQQSFFINNKLPTSQHPTNINFAFKFIRFRLSHFDSMLSFNIKSCNYSFIPIKLILCQDSLQGHMNSRI